MKYKITHRLILYFSAVLLSFSIIVSILCGIQFTQHAAGIHEAKLEKQAVSIAQTLSEFLQKYPGTRKGFSSYLRFIDDISEGEAWLVDENAQTIELSTANYTLSYEELPSGTEKLIERVFDGNVVSSRLFSPVLDVPSITVGAPVRDSEGRVTGAFLLHSPVTGITEGQKYSFIILFSCLFIALLFSLALSVLLAGHFITPLKEIGQAAEQVMAGDYSARANVTQQDEIGDLACNINELFARLSDIEKERKKLDKMQQDFVSNVSHELRTPITVIRGSLEVLEEGLVTDPEGMKEYFHQMLSDTVHLQRLVNDLLELSRLQNSSFQIHKSELNLTDLISDAVRSMQRISEKKQVQIQFINEVGLLLFCGDYDRLRQMFITILDNSIKFSPSNTTVSVRLYQQGDQYTVSVTDCGSGILPEDIPYIFHRFYKKQTQQNANGSGLGLPIAKQIADRHGIKIRCQSILHDYTTFFFEFTEYCYPASSLSDDPKDV